MGNIEDHLQRVSPNMWKGFPGRAGSSGGLEGASLTCTKGRVSSSGGTPVFNVNSTWINYWYQDNEQTDPQSPQQSGFCVTKFVP